MPISLEVTHRCEWCDGPVTTYGKGRPRRYCTHACRDAHYRDQQRNRLGRNEKACTECGLIHAGECP